MEGLKIIQSYKFDKRASGIASWVFDLLVPGKDYIDIAYDDIHGQFIYTYRGQSDFDVATVKIPSTSEEMKVEGEIEIVSALKDNHLLGDGLICTLLDKTRNVVITIFKGASSGGIDVTLRN